KRNRVRCNRHSRMSTVLYCHCPPSPSRHTSESKSRSERHPTFASTSTITPRPTTGFAARSLCLRTSMRCASWTATALSRSTLAVGIAVNSSRFPTTSSVSSSKNAAPANIAASTGSHALAAAARRSYESSQTAVATSATRRDGCSSCSTRSGPLSSKKHSSRFSSTTESTSGPCGRSSIVAVRNEDCRPPSRFQSRVVRTPSSPSHHTPSPPTTLSRRTDTMPDINPDDIKPRLRALGLFGLIACWDHIADKPWLQEVLTIEERERQKRSLERRLRHSRVSTFKPMADFDWEWPKKIDREAVEDLFSLACIKSGHNTILVGPNGVGKTMILKNAAHQAVVRGHTVRFATASDM